MSSRQQRGRGVGHARGGHGSSPGRGGRGDRGGNRGQSGGGPPGAGQSTQMPSRGGPPAPGGRGDIYLGSASAPDPTVTATEDALVAQTRGRNFDGFTGRRGYGTKGREITLRTNYFKIDTPYDSNDSSISEKVLYRYDVEVAGTQLSRPKQRQLLKVIVADPHFAGVLWATDYSRIIVTTQKLDLGPNNAWQGTKTLPPQAPLGSAAPRNSAQGPAPAFVQAAQARNNVRFRVTYVDSYSLQHMLNYLRSHSAGAAYDHQATIVQLLNIIMAKHPQDADNIIGAGQNKFYPIMSHPGKESFPLGGGLEALRGYFSSVRPAINRLLVNINVTSGAFYKPISLYDLVQESGASTPEQREAFIEKLKVRVDYKRDNETTPSATKLATIVGFARPTATVQVTRFGNAHQVTFRYVNPSTPDAPGRNISVFEYFRDVRGITLQKPNIPVLNVGTRGDPAYIPVEICTVEPGQPYRKMLGGGETSEMIKFAARYPNLNAMSIAGTLSAPGNGIRLFRLAGPPDAQRQSVNRFGFGVNTQMISVPGRILQGPKVSYRDSTVTPDAEKAQWNLFKQKFAIPGRFGKWQALVINGDASEGLFSELERQLKGYGLGLGQRVATQRIKLDPPTIANRPSNDRQIRAAFQKAKQQEVEVAFVVLPSYDKWLYARIKFYGDIEFGVHSISAIGSKVLKQQGQAAFMGNLALKFNVKAGGVTHKIPSLLSGPLDNNTMLVGIDVTHPSPGSSEGAPSIACVVASVDEHLFHWPGSIRTQTGRVEMVQGLEAMFRERLALWRKKHNRLPDKVIIYRDGVSEGQYALLLSEELPPIQEAFKKEYGQERNWPKLALIVVGKRHHTRFFPTSRDDADKKWNPLPGTIVDRGIVGPILREFYLQPHQGMQGTARPAHYVVLKDDITFEADDLEQFTLKMCYTFSRATKAVSICPPAYYADLLAERGRAYLFSTLAENHGDNSSAYSASTAEWTGGVHPRLAESTWYI